MKINELEREIRTATRAYEAEIRKNKNMNGSVLSLILRTRIEMLEDLKFKYFK